MEGSNAQRKELALQEAMHDRKSGNNIAEIEN